MEITKEEWMEVRKVCSGPPLELKEQAKPTEALEPSEVDFSEMYHQAARDVVEDAASDHRCTLDAIEVYLQGTGSRIPREQIDCLLDAAGCATTDWSQVELELLEGYDDLGSGRSQGSLF